MEYKKVQLDASLIINICQTLHREQQRSPRRDRQREEKGKRVGLILCGVVGSVCSFLHFFLLIFEISQKHEEFYRMQDVQKFNSCWLLLLFYGFVLNQPEEKKDLNDFLQFCGYALWDPQKLKEESERLCWKLPKINSPILCQGVIQRCKVNHDISSHRLLCVCRDRKESNEIHRN